MGIYTMGAPKSLVLSLQKQYAIQTFIETGTYYGGTSTWASDHFSKVITIENSKAIHEKTAAKYKHITNIDFLFGHSLEHLKNIVANLKEPALFWLDAHWSGGETYGINDECPLIEELRIINDSKINHIVLIDDARMFVKPPKPPHKPEQWATISQIIIELNKIADRYCFIAADVIGAVPNSAVKNIIPYFEEVAKFEETLQPPRISFVDRVKRKLKTIC